jgi:hypothetical protein
LSSDITELKGERKLGGGVGISENMGCRETVSSGAGWRRAGAGELLGPREEWT